MARNVDSLGVQKQLNTLFEQRLDIETRILDTMQQELKVAMQLQAVMNGLKADELVDRLNEGTKAMEALADKASETGDIGTQAMKKIEEGSKSASKETSAVSKAMGGIGTMLKGILSSAAGVAGSMLRIGKAVGSIPMAIFKNLLNDAASFAGDTSFMEALEAIRKDFGSFKEDVSKNILGAYKTVNSELQQMTGLSVWQVFGTPADQLKYLHEIASKAGAQMHQFGEEIAKSGGAIAAFDKGMGIGAENLRAFMNRATVMGTDLQSQLKDTANYALQLGKAFGMSSKTLSKDVGMMMKDVKNFGSLTQKEMTVAAVYTKKLGLEIKDLTGLVGQFDNFDKAAESAALLSQAFGASVDAFKLMNEQDPAKRLDDLRKSMAATGKTTENMTRQELKLLAQTSGLSEEAAKLAFSNKNQGLSYDEVQKQANKAENAQITQAEALKKLADNIERVVRQGGQLHGSFFKMFFAGMERGIKWSKEYMGAMMGVRNALWATHQAGMEFGRAFVASDNVGFGKFMKAFGNTFSAANVNKLFRGWEKEIEVNGKKTKVKIGGVLEDLNQFVAGKMSFDQVLTSLRTKFRMVAGEAQINEMKEAGKKMMMFLAKGIGSGASFIVKELTNILKFLTNPRAAMEKAKAAGSEGASFGMELAKTVKESFGDPATLHELKVAAFDFLKALGKKLKELSQDPQVKALMGEVGGALLGVIAGPALLKMLPSVAGPIVRMLGRSLLTAGGGVGAAVTGVALAGAALVNVNKKMDKFANDVKGPFDKTAKKVGGYAASLVQGLTLGLLPDNITQMLADTVAEFADKAFDALTGAFGGPFTNKLKKYFSAHMDFLGSIGGLIGAIFSGDSAQISAAAEKMGTSFVNLVSAAFDFLITEFPKLVMKLGSTIQTVLGGLLDGFGKALENLGSKIPIVGGVISGFGTVLRGLGWAFKELGKLTDWAFEKIKNFDLTATLSESFNKMKLVLADAGIAILKNIPSVIAVPLGLGNAEQRGKAIGEMLAWKQGVEQNMKDAADAAAKAAQEAADKQKQIADQAAQAVQAPTAPTTSGAAPSESQVKALQDFNEKIKVPAQAVMDITAGVTKSINELNDILSDGSKGAMQIGAKLKRFADSSGLGKNGTYEIKNKGIVLKLDLKVTMDAGEVEKAIVLRKDSILFDAIEDITTLSSEHAQKLNEIKAMKGGG